MARDKKKRGGKSATTTKPASVPTSNEEINGKSEEVEQSSMSMQELNEALEETGEEPQPKKETLKSKSKAIDDTISPRTVTGVLSSQYLSRDVKIDAFSLNYYGMELITDTRLEFNFGRRYGILGFNGSGKSTLLNCIGKREIPIPQHIAIYHLDREIEASEKTALEAVIGDIEAEKQQLEQEAEGLVGMEGGSDSERIMDLYDKIDELDVDTAPKRAGEILHGLGFTHEMQLKQTKDFSGGWRMRIALARALFMAPTMLLLDEPTNHLDLEATVWLEEYLKQYKRILVLISHSQDFLNNVCTNIILLTKNKQLEYYSGNYDTYIRTRAEKEENQMKQYKWEQEQIKHMKEYIARFGHGSAKLAAQAQSKEKTLAKMQEKGLTEKVVADRTVNFYFPDCGKLPPPVLTFNKVSFGYKPGQLVYKDLEFGLDLDSRVALVGPNGAGKSTLLKLMNGVITPTNGIVRRHNHLKIGWYHQHLAEHLDLTLSPLQYMMNQFPGVEFEAMRRIIGRYGITGKTQLLPIQTLSDGQKSRVVFAWLSYQNPHLLLLDEPTNHLDIETIDALADAINEFDGGIVLVSHDFRLINQVAKEIWVCDHGKVTPWKGNILDYKKTLRQKMNLE
jgi:ATP-binding cassette subfamily F protein 2